MFMRANRTDTIVGGREWGFRSSVSKYNNDDTWTSFGEPDHLYLGQFKGYIVCSMGGGRNIPDGQRSLVEA